MQSRAPHARGNPGLTTRPSRVESSRRQRAPSRRIFRVHPGAFGENCRWLHVDEKRRDRWLRRGLKELIDRRAHDLSNATRSNADGEFSVKGASVGNVNDECLHSRVSLLQSRPVASGRIFFAELPPGPPIDRFDRFDRLRHRISPLGDAAVGGCRGHPDLLQRKFQAGFDRAQRNSGKRRDLPLT